LPATIPA